MILVFPLPWSLVWVRPQGPLFKIFHYYCGIKDVFSHKFISSFCTSLCWVWVLDFTTVSIGFFFFNPFFKIQFGVFEAVKINIIRFSSQDSHGSMGLRGDGIQKIPFQLQNVSGIVKISSGADHFVMLTSRGTVLTAGCPEQGQVNKKLSCVSGVVQIRSGAD